MKTAARVCPQVHERLENKGRLSIYERRQPDNQKSVDTLASVLPERSASVQPLQAAGHSSVRALAAAGAYLGISSVILRIKSDFSAQPLQDSPHSSRIFFRSFTFSFFRSTVDRSSCLSAGDREKTIIQDVAHSCRSSNSAACDRMLEVQH